jgi:hypothetical protein
MKLKDIPIILHTMDSYDRYWDYWWYFTNKYCQHKNIIFASESLDPTFKDNVKQFKTGKGQWGERLLKILSNIDTNYIFYMQEDFWPISDFPYTQEIIDKVINEKINCWRISEDSSFYSLDEIEPNIFKYQQNSSYTLSHQFSLWEVSFLKKYIEPQETPWDNEAQGSTRMNNEEVEHKIYFQKNYWYRAVVRQGKLEPVGKELLTSENLKYE